MDRLLLTVRLAPSRTTAVQEREETRQQQLAINMLQTGYKLTVDSYSDQWSV